ncbi:MAG: HPF/RaiA family ribosome-associated protein [Candidatus Curtissbacteria bacterium]|nr:HPF/RaiA family ribosome-associated protein [Candidatus Curtissbacteria bacterium]
MNLCITARQYRLSSHLWDSIDRHVQKLEQWLPHIDRGLGLIKVVIKRNRRRNFFDGSIYLSLPKKHLYTYFQGANADEAINQAFEHLFKELSRYKGKHFTNDSQYYRHESVRRNYGF